MNQCSQSIGASSERGSATRNHESIALPRRQIQLKTDGRELFVRSSAFTRRPLSRKTRPPQGGTPNQWAA